MCLSRKMNVSKVETNRGQKSIIWGGYIYILEQVRKLQRGTTSDLEPRRRQQKTHVGEEALQPHDIKIN